MRTRPFVDEVLVVDDGSDDRTAEVAKQANAIVYRHEVNGGKGVAIKAAIRYARSKGFGVLVLLDGDGQHDPENIPGLLAPIVNGEADLVLGCRDRDSSKMPRYRRFGMRILDVLTGLAGMDDIRDSQSGFRALSRTAIESLEIEEPQFSVESEMLIEAKEKGLRIAEAPIKVRYDVDGSTKGPFVHGIGVVDRILRIIAVRRPLLFFGVPGAAMFIIGLWLGFETIEVYNAIGLFAVGKALLALIFLMLGALSVFTAIILNVMPKAIIRAEARRNNIQHGEWK